MKCTENLIKRNQKNHNYLLIKQLIANKFPAFENAGNFGKSIEKTET